MKEVLYDTLGVGDRAWSQRLGAATFPLLFYFAEQQLSVGRSVAIEANFDRRYASDRFAALADRVTFRPVQIYCFAQPEILYERFLARAPTRHPGHVDHEAAADVRRAIADGRHGLLPLGDAVVEIDTSSLPDLDLAPALELVRARVDDDPL